MPELWPGILDELATLVDANGGLLFAVRDKVLNWTSSPVLSDVFQSYVNDGWFARCDRIWPAPPWFRRARASKTPRVPATPSLPALMSVTPVTTRRQPPVELLRSLFGQAEVTAILANLALGTDTTVVPTAASPLTGAPRPRTPPVH